MSNELYRTKPEWQKRALINSDERQNILRQSGEDPDSFWAEKAKRIQWVKPFTQVQDTSFQTPVHVNWFKDGELNA
ncbi:MAG: hypothetical protein KDD38_09865, partial [Bdellovibrionales bacterium]|nr:hypothetical protein [Bdellovibrionales bacterium]